MSKIKKELITSAWHNLSTETSNKFWGLIAVLTSVRSKEKIKAGRTYSIDTVKLSETLERLFYFGDTQRTYHENEHYVTFSSVWVEKALANFTNGKVSISDAAIYYQIDRNFDENIDVKFIVDHFIEELGLNEEDIVSLFDTEYSNYGSITEDDFSKRAIIQQISSQYSIPTNNDTLTFEPPYSVVSHPAELSRAPFIQSLYAAQSNFECLILTKFDFNELYVSSITNSQIGGVNLLNNVSIEELGQILGRNYNSAGDKKQVTAIYIFGIKYGGVIRTNGYPPKTIIEISGLSESYVSELTKALNLYDSINSNLFGVKFSNRKQAVKTCRNNCQQTIFYGAPGTGKSHKVKGITSGQNKTVITFHPDTDYASFVGAYKPTLHEDGEKITYGFVPQAFAIAYVNAWKDTDKDYFLVIEEINRGNCAQIFGDIFQLLDRRADGFSDYVIDVDKDFADYVKKELSGIDGYEEKITELAEAADIEEEFSYSKIALPSNLHILATMNTSDQSLFPMDSAFKRRWDWEYMPIDYTKASEFTIIVGDAKYNWGAFIEEVNKRIKEISNSEDKQIGTFFVKAPDKIITFEQFRSKVMFYLWFEVYKEEMGTGDCIFRRKDADDKGFCFGDLFNSDAETLTKDFLEFIGIKPIASVTGSVEPQVEGSSNPTELL